MDAMPWATLTSPGGPCSILAPLAAQSSGRSGLFRSMTVRSTALSSTKAKRTSLLVRFASDSPLARGESGTNTMNEVVATTAKLSKTCSQPAALLLKGFKHREVAQSDLE